MPVVRKIRDAEDALACLSSAEQAGQTPRDWAHAHGVDARSLHMWRVLLSRPRTSAPPAPLRLVELIPAVRPTPPARYRLCCGDVSLELGEHFDDQVVLRLLRLVRAC